VKTKAGRNTLVNMPWRPSPTPWVAPCSIRRPQEFDGIFDRINRELRTQYRLGYYPEPRGPQHLSQNRNQGDRQLSSPPPQNYLTGPQ